MVPVGMLDTGPADLGPVVELGFDPVVSKPDTAEVADLCSAGQGCIFCPPGC